MKKFVIVLLSLIIVLAVVLYLKMNPIGLDMFSISTSKPSPSSFPNFADISDSSSEDIEKLILKGKETINNADNVYYENWTQSILFKYYSKSSKLKCETYYLSSPTATSFETAEKALTEISNFDDYTATKFYHIEKIKRTVNYAIVSRNLFQEKLIDLVEDRNEYITKFVYVKDDILEERDCIIVKAFRYDTKTYEPETTTNTITAYWIEKSTGFYVGRAVIEPNEDTFQASSTIKNLSFDTVKDSDFEEPEL